MKLHCGLLKRLQILGMQRTGNTNSQQLCWHFQHGTCRFGENCRYSHDESMASVSPSMRTSRHNSYQRTPQSAPRYSGNSYRPRENHGRSYNDSRNPPPAFDEREWAPNVEGNEAVAAARSSTMFPFRLMTYNLLADKLGYEHRHELYPDTRHHHLDWYDHRWPLALSEITHWKPDVLCLQEVDHYDRVKQDLAQLGYRGRYAQRTGGRGDGCATFWLPSQLRLVSSEVLYMAHHNLKDNVALLLTLQPRVTAGDGSGHDDCQHQQDNCHGLQHAASDATMSVGRESVAALSDEEQAQGSRCCIIGNTHILFNNKRGDVKLGQLRTILCRMNELAQQLSAAGGLNPACILAGDFNSAPGSGVYHFLTHGHLDLPSHDRRDLSGQNEGYGYSAYYRDLRNGRSSLKGYVPPAEAVASPPGNSQSDSPIAADRQATVDSEAQHANTATTPVPPERAVRRSDSDMEMSETENGNGNDAVVAEIAAIAAAAAAAAASQAKTSDTAAGQAGNLRFEVLQVDKYAGPYTPHIYPPWQNSNYTGIQNKETIETNSVVMASVVASPAGTGIAVQATVREGALEATEQLQVMTPEPLIPPATPVTPSASPSQSYGAPPRTPKTWPQASQQQQSIYQRTTRYLQYGNTKGGRSHFRWEEEELEAAMGAEAARQLLTSLNLPGHDNNNHQQQQVQHAVSSIRKQQARQGLLVTKNPLRLASAYLQAAGHEPTFTTCHKRCIDTVDYIWFTPEGAFPTQQQQQQQQQQGIEVEAELQSNAEGEGSTACQKESKGKDILRAIKVLQPPDHERFHQGMPNENWASDHISLLCDFELALV